MVVQGAAESSGAPSLGNKGCIGEREGKTIALSSIWRCTNKKRSAYPLAIVLVGVGDGPWEDMRKFDDRIPARDYDNFQFVNFTEIMSRNISPSEKEAAFALAALMEIPFQYKATMEFGILGRVTGRAKRIVPKAPPLPYSRPAPSLAPPSSNDDNNQSVCPVCLTNPRDLAFGCGHMSKNEHMLYGCVEYEFATFSVYVLLIIAFLSL
ncbi:hypothetical protein V8G54_027549 [Vigna mungo]|uniref:Copine C-terminal domain-containing protein n=1 Tax=Vigna mungo TaxID=3915 RepID=A0AAQ3N2P1_VIGMU